MPPCANTAEKAAELIEAAFPGAKPE